MNPSEEIKSRLDIVDVLREYIQLKPAGINFRANCPFHNEKSPSFMVSPEKQIWHCFGCGKGGDIFSFVMEYDGISFVEALRELAPKAGVELKAENQKVNSERNRLLDMMRLASRYYNHVLRESKLAKPALEYLRQRGLTDETIDEWQIGYSPDSWDDLINFLKSRDYKENEIFLAGLSIKKDGTNKFYNRFRGRIMFPISDVNSNVVAFTARVSPEKESTEKMGKYINSPQTQIFDKGKILFGLDRAKNKIRQDDLAIIAEGQMDVITAHQYGFKNVVASSGTALSDEQFSLIIRYTRNIAFALDADSAGQNASDRARKLLDLKERTSRVSMSEGKYSHEKFKFIDASKNLSINFKFIEIPNGKDPDEYIKNNHEEWEKLVENQKDVMQYIIDKAIENKDLDNIENQRKIKEAVLVDIYKLGQSSRSEQDFWIKKLSEKLKISETSIREDLVNYKPEEEWLNPKINPNNKFEPKSLSREELMSELLLSLVIKFPEHFDYIFNNIQMDQLWGGANKELYRNLIIYYNKVTDSSNETGGYQIEKSGSELANYRNFRDWLIGDLLVAAGVQYKNNDFQLTPPAQLDRLALLAEKDFFDFDSIRAKEEIINTVIFLKRNYLLSRLKEIEHLIIQSEKEKDNNRLKELLEEFKLLSDELKENQ